MSTQTVILSVRMSCEGCSGAVKRVLSKMEGVESFDIDMEQQKVTVKGNVEPEVVLQTVAKTGKKSSFWEEEVAPDSKSETKAAEVEAETEPAVKLEANTAEVKAETEAEVKTKAKAAEIEEVETEAVVKTKAVAEVEEEITTSVQTEKTKPEEEAAVAST